MKSFLLFWIAFALLAMLTPLDRIANSLEILTAAQNK